MATDTTTLREAFRFHLEHGGYCTPPGRAQCALDAARAELALRAAVNAGRAIVDWDDDDISIADMADALESGEIEGPFVCMIYVGGEVVASLGGITLLPSDFGFSRARGYGRVIEAELALEAIDDLTGPISNREGIRRMLDNL